MPMNGFLGFEDFFVQRSLDLARRLFVELELRAIFVQKKYRTRVLPAARRGCPSYDRIGKDSSTIPIVRLAGLGAFPVPRQRAPLDGVWNSLFRIDKEG